MVYTHQIFGVIMDEYANLVKTMRIGLLSFFFKNAKIVFNEKSVNISLYVYNDNEIFQKLCQRYFNNSFLYI